MVVGHFFFVFPNGSSPVSLSYVFPVFVFRLIEGGSMKTHVCCHFRTEREYQSSRSQ